MGMRCVCIYFDLVSRTFINEKASKKALTAESVVNALCLIIVT